MVTPVKAKLLGEMVLHVLVGVSWKVKGQGGTMGQTNRPLQRLQGLGFRVAMTPEHWLSGIGGNRAVMGGYDDGTANHPSS